MARTDANPPMMPFTDAYTLVEVDAEYLSKAVKPKQPVKKRKVAEVEGENSGKRISMRTRGKDPNGEEAKSKETLIADRLKDEELEKQRPQGEISFKETNEEFIENLIMLNGESSTSAISFSDEKNSNSSKLFVDFHLPIKSGTVKVTKNMVYSIAIHPSQLTILATVGDKQGHLAIWDVSDTLEKSKVAGEDEIEPIVHTFKPHSRAVSHMLYSKSEMTLYTSSHDGYIRLMDLTSASFKEVYVCQDQNPIAQFDLLNDQTLWWCNHQGEIGRTDVRESANRIQIYQASPKKLNTIHFSTNTNYFTTAGLDHIVRIFDIRKLSDEPEPISTFTHGKSVNSAYWDPKGLDILSVSFDDSIVLWKDAVSNSSHKHVIRHNNNTGKRGFYVRKVDSEV